MIDALEDGADLVSGWKAERRDAWTKRAASKVFNGVTARLSGLALHDLNCGLKAYRAEVVRSLSLSGDLYRYIPVMAAAEGFRVREMAVNHRPRRFGVSKYGLERYVRGFLDLLTIMFIGRFRWRPMHLFGGLGLAFSIVGVGISRLHGGPQDRWATPSATGRSCSSACCSSWSACSCSRSASSAR